MDVPCISTSMDIPCISTSMDIHGIPMDIPRIYHVYVGELHIRGIYHVHAWYIPNIRITDGFDYYDIIVNIIAMIS